MAKHEWRKKEKHLYLPKTHPELVTIPPLNFITLNGEGNPNSEQFGECIGALYAVAYTIKMNLKKEESKPAGYQDYTVYPLEGIWDLNDKGRAEYDGTFNKDNLVFKLMSRQPNFVTEDYFNEMKAFAYAKKHNELVKKVQFEAIEDGRCVQMMHIGSYDNEPASFAQMEAFTAEQSIVRASKVHREIYISDFRKVPTEKLKTVLRFWVK